MVESNGGMVVRGVRLSCFFLGGLLLVAGMSSGGFGAKAFADNGASPEGQRLVRVHLRGVRAVRAKGGAVQSFSEGLQDIAQKLGELPFAQFTLLTNEEFQVPLHRKQSFPFGRNHTVTVRPIDAAEGAIILWLSWRDERGGKVLDTRVRLAEGEQMVAGTNSHVNLGGTILVVGAR